MSGFLLWAAVGVLGGAGAVARFVLDAAVAARGRSVFPLGTLAVNLSGAFALGLLVGVALRGDALLLAGTATLGSYTTFSTWMLETQRLGEEGDYTPMIANAIASLACGVGAAALGRALGGAL